MSEPDGEQLVAIDERIAHFRSRLDDACRDAGRAAAEVTLIAVTKNHPPSFAARAAANGLLDLGENKPQELALKRAGLAELDPELAQRATWHFIGRLQRNKAKQVVANADIVHSIDRAAVATAVAKAAQASERWSGQPLPVLMQINLDPAAPRGEHNSTAARGGVHPLDAPALAEQIAGLDALLLRGVMAVAPLGGDPAPAFATLRELSDQLRAEHPQADLISAGMTADFPAAIANGATHVRVGTALFGERALA